MGVRSRTGEKLCLLVAVLSGCLVAVADLEYWNADIRDAANLATFLPKGSLCEPVQQTPAHPHLGPERLQREAEP